MRENEYVEISVRMPDGKRQLRRLRRRWESNIRMDVREIRRGDIHWDTLVQNRDKRRAFVSMVTDFRAP
jgi:hypothetical protein